MSQNPPPTSSLNLPFVEELYARFIESPESVSASWRGYFESLGPDDLFRSNPRLGPSFDPGRVFDPPGNGHPNDHDGIGTAEFIELQDRVDQLIRAYRVRGHLIAHFDPLGLPRTTHAELELGYYGLTEADLRRTFSSRTITGSPGRMTLGEIIEHLQTTYCRYIGVQFMHIDDLEIKSWLHTRMESSQNRLRISRDEQLRILTKLTDAVIFEDFIQKKYLGAKRFSLEGAESLIPLLDMAIDRAGEQGQEEIVIGMAHRGRLNVLANIIGKPASQIFWEFEDADPELYLGGGDVKYHLGHSGDIVTSSGQNVHVSLCFNPSHLEFVNPVALGRMRAKQDRIGPDGQDRGMVFLIHGDAAFTGQGVIQETFNLSELDGYATGGTLHVIVNNQIGFTTSPREGRSSIYASAVAKMLQIPIFHVNGEHPESVAQVLRLAMDFRVRFKRDVVIDMYSYRLHGHNETDEPAFTHPVMYEAIRKKKSVRSSYLEHLLKLGEITAVEGEEIAIRQRKRLEADLSQARDPEYVAEPQLQQGIWANGYVGGSEVGVPDIDTGVRLETLREVMETITSVPEGFQVHRKLARYLSQRTEMGEGRRPLDWATAEALALGTVALEGHPVRLSGQDSGRGTFSHRHAILHDSSDGRPYIALQHLSPDQARVEILNSPLSEVGVMGFECGYSLSGPESLVLWEAQFGDFCNVAQVIIDQFLISAEDKWRRLNSLVLLLPHGFEGQGPEHSSARLERFLMLAAEDNIQIVNATTPAQYFHVLRRQVIRPWRKPLIIMTPKSLLRHAEAVSDLDELTAGRFRRIVPDPRRRNPKEIRRVLCCSGKIYYELEKARADSRRDDIDIIRFEQLYPFEDADLAGLLSPYPAGTPVVWVQEEPENAGAWRYLRVKFGTEILERHPFSGIYRDASASPATGSAASHRLEQEWLLARAIEYCPRPGN